MMARKSLVVEDQEQVRHLVSHVLSSLNSETLEAASEQAGWTIFREHAPEIGFIFLDYSLENGNGYSLYKRIRSLSPELKIVMSSAWPDAKVEEIVNDPHAAFLQKPFSMKRLMEEAHSALAAGASAE